MISRRAALALFALAVHVTAFVVTPALHLAHHRADHVHGAGGALTWIAAGDEAAPPIESEHLAFDDDLEALGLAEAGHFGVAAVDCELAEYTLAACATRALHTFGDELIARLPHRHPAPFDPEHGRGSPGHLRLALLDAPPIALPPPPSPLVRTPHARVALVDGALASPRLRARAPPASRPS